MTAGVHDSHRGALVVAGFHRAGIGSAGLFDHRQRVHVCAHQNGRAGAVAEHTHHSVAAHPPCDLVTELLQLIRQTRGGLLLLQRKFRVRMEVLVNWFEARRRLGDTRLDVLAHCLRYRSRARGLNTAED